MCRDVFPISMLPVRKRPILSLWVESQECTKRGKKLKLKSKVTAETVIKVAKVVTESENKPQKVKKTKPGVITGVDVPPWNLD